MLGLLDQGNQRGRITRDATDLKLVAGQMQLGDKRVVRQDAAERFQHDHARRRLVFAPLQQRQRRALATVPARAERRAALGDLPVELGFLRAEAVGEIACGDRSDDRGDCGESQHRLQRPAQPRRIDRAARPLLEHLDARARGRLRRDRDRGRVEARQRLDITHRQPARRGCDLGGDALAAMRRWPAATEHGLARAPRRQSVDLCPHDTVEEIRGAGRQLQRSEQEARRPQHDFDAAAADDLRQIGTGELAVLERDLLQDVLRLRSLQRERAGLALDQPHHARRHHPFQGGDDGTGHGAGPGIGNRAKGTERTHLTEAFRRSRRSRCATTIHDTAHRRFREGG